MAAPGARRPASQARVGITMTASARPARLTAEISTPRRQGLDPARHWRRHTRVDICGETPIVRRHSAPGLEVTFETIVPGRCRNGASMRRSRIRGGSLAAPGRRLRTASRSTRAWLSDLASSTHRSEPAHDPIWGSLENRARFGLDVLARPSGRGRRMPVIYRLSVEDYFAGGLPWNEGSRSRSGG